MLTFCNANHSVIWKGEVGSTLIWRLSCMYVCWMCVLLIQCTVCTVGYKLWVSVISTIYMSCVITVYVVNCCSMFCFHVVLRFQSLRAWSEESLCLSIFHINVPFSEFLHWHTIWLSLESLISVGLLDILPVVTSIPLTALLLYCFF